MELSFGLHYTLVVLVISFQHKLERKVEVLRLVTR